MQAADCQNELETLATLLERSGEYRILRRLVPRPPMTPPVGETTRVGLFVDVETTGLDPSHDEIIELAMVPFTYGIGGEIYEIGKGFSALRDPEIPIPPRVTAITGITDDMVRGRTIDPAEIMTLVGEADLVVAHNATFDRPFLEAFCNVFATLPWACSMSDVDWAAEGYEGTKLCHLAAQAGFFYDKHRATHDCLAGIEILARHQPVSGRSGLQHLLDRARAPYCRIWAISSPFDLKDQLKARGYRWNADAISGYRAWYIDLPVEAKDAELAFLVTEIYRQEVDLPVRSLDAYNRFTSRI